MAAKVFIDGKEGTTGLRIFDRLTGRADVTLLTLPEEMRKDPEARRARLHEADIAILCLPDAASRESVALAEGSDVRILDTSTAHRRGPGSRCRAAMPAASSRWSRRWCRRGFCRRTRSCPASR